MDIAQRKQHIEKVFDILEKTHINLYHHISKEKFKKCQAEFAQTAEFLETEQFDKTLAAIEAIGEAEISWKPVL